MLKPQIILKKKKKLCLVNVYVICSYTSKISNMRNTIYISKIDFKKNHNRWTQKSTRKDEILRVVTYPKELKSGKRQMNENGKQSHISHKMGMKPKPTFWL